MTPFDLQTIIAGGAGAAAIATGIAGVIELAKKLIPGLDEAQPRTLQQLAAGLALGAVIYGAIATAIPIDAVSIGALAAAWYAIARLATATYDVARTTAQVVKATVGSANAVDGAGLGEP